MPTQFSNCDFESQRKILNDTLKQIGEAEKAVPIPNQKEDFGYKAGNDVPIPEW